jgi:hypothetical protein
VEIEKADLDYVKFVKKIIKLIVKQVETTHFSDKTIKVNLKDTLYYEMNVLVAIVVNRLANLDMQLFNITEGQINVDFLKNVFDEVYKTQMEKYIDTITNNRLIH